MNSKMVAIIQELVQKRKAFALATVVEVTGSVRRHERQRLRLWPAAPQHERIAQRGQRLEHDQLACQGRRQPLARLVPAQRAQP